MCEQTPFSYQSGQVVWVKLGSCWWPGEARSYEELPEDAKTSFKKIPVTAVQFFQEEKYEYVRNYDQVCLYNCKRKNEFIQKGLEMLRKHKNENFMNKFPSDVIRAEELTNGDPNIIKKFQLMPDERPDYNVIFGKNGKSPRKGRSPRVKRKSMPARTKIDFNVLVPENRVPFARHSDSSIYLSKGDHTSFIRVQPRPEKNDGDTNASNGATEQVYSCFVCDFKTKRIEGFMAHRKSHLSLSYGAPKPQIITPKRSRKKSEGSGGRKKSSYTPASLQSSGNKRHLSFGSKSQSNKSETVESEFSKTDHSKLETAGKVNQKKKVIFTELESSELKSSTKTHGGKKKTPRKRKNEDVFKTQLLADWDDEDPTLLQQEQESIKKKCKASCFDFDDSADSILDTELEERANKFARTRNIPIIPKSDTSAKKQRLQDLPSTSKEFLMSNKRSVEAPPRHSKRIKMSADQNEEDYAKLILGDAVPEYEPQLDSSPPGMLHTENNNTVLEEGKDDSEVLAPTVDGELKELPEVPRVSSAATSSTDQEADVCVLDVSDDCDSNVGLAHVDGHDSEIGFCDELQLCSAVSKSKNSNEGVRYSTREHAYSGKEVAVSHVEPEVVEETPSSEVESRETAFDHVEEFTSSDNSFVDDVSACEAKGTGKSEHTVASDLTCVAGDVNVDCDVEAENVEHSNQSELKDDDDDNDMPEIICVEHHVHNKHGAESSHNNHMSNFCTQETQELERNIDEVGVPSSDELCLEEVHSHASVELSNDNKEADDEVNVPHLNESSARNMDKNHVFGCVSEPLAEHTYDTLPCVNKEIEEDVQDADNSEEITIIGYKCATNTDFKDVDEKLPKEDESRKSSREGSVTSDLPESAEVMTGDSHPSAEHGGAADSALVQEPNGSADSKNFEKEEICVDDDSSSTKVTESLKTDVSREEIVAEWSDEFDEDNHIATPMKEKVIEVIDLDKSESEDLIDNEVEATGLHTADDCVSSNVESVMEEGKKDMTVIKNVSASDGAKDDEMELDINSMPVVVEDAVIKDDGSSNYGSMPPSTTHISVVETPVPTCASPKTTTLLLGPTTTAVKPMANNIIVVSSQSRQLPLTARGVFTSPHSKVVIMPRAAKGKNIAPMLVANSSGLTTRMYTESEQECLFKEGKKTLLQRVRPKLTIQTSKTKPLLPNIQKGSSGIEAPTVKIIQGKNVVLPGTSLMATSPSGITTSLKVDPAGMQNVAVQGTLPKILVHTGTSKILLPKSMSNVTAVPSGTGPQGLKRVTNIFPLVKGSGTNMKQLIISQPGAKPLKVQASGLLTPPLKKTRRMFTCQSTKASPSLKSVPTTTIEISVSGVQSTQPVTITPTVQRGVNVSAIPRIPSSTIALPGTPESTASSIMVGNQDSPSFVFIVDSGKIQQYNTAPKILSYNSGSQNTTPQSVYLEPSSLTTSGSLDNMMITLDGTSANATPGRVFIPNSGSGQDILATALANTEVFQAEASLQDTLAVVSNEQSFNETSAMLPNLQGVLPVANPSEVLETLTLKEPIMTPHEVPSCVTSIQIPPPAPVSLHASLAASPSMPLLTDDPIDHIHSPRLELYENSASQDGVTVQASLNEEPQIIGDEGR